MNGNKLLKNLRITLEIAQKSRTNVELKPDELWYLLERGDNAENRLCLLQLRINRIVGILQGDDEESE